MHAERCCGGAARGAASAPVKRQGEAGSVKATRARARVERRRDGKCSGECAPHRLACLVRRAAVVDHQVRPRSLGLEAQRLRGDAGPRVGLARTVPRHQPLQLRLRVHRHNDDHRAEAVQPRLEEERRIHDDHRGAQGELVDQRPEQPEGDPRLQDLVELLSEGSVVEDDLAEPLAVDGTAAEDGRPKDCHHLAEGEGSGHKGLPCDDVEVDDGNAMLGTQQPRDRRLAAGDAAGEADYLHAGGVAARPAGVARSILRRLRTRSARARSPGRGGGGGIPADDKGTHESRA